MREQNSITWLSRISIFILAIVLGCAKDDTKPILIPSDFIDYVNRFVAEGKARGVTVDASKLIIEFVDNITVSGVTLCGYSLTGSTPHIQISQPGGCWTTRADINRELLLFHEMGHALLGRVHDNNQYSNGLFKTIMNTGPLSYLYTEYTPALRTYYLDELFNPSTIPPTALLPKSNQVLIYTDSIRGASSSWTYYKPDSLNHIGAISSAAFATPKHSLSIRGVTKLNSSSLSYYYTTLDYSQIPMGSDLQLKVKIKLDNVADGHGVTLVMRSEVNSKIATYQTLYGTTDIKGTKDFTEYTLNLPYFPANVGRLVVYLIFYGDTTGTVYFDDVTLTNWY